MSFHFHSCFQLSSRRNIFRTWGPLFLDISLLCCSIQLSILIILLELQLSDITGQPLYLSILESRGIFTREYWYWIGIGALIGYIVLFNVMVTFALQHLSRKRFISVHSNTCQIQCYPYHNRTFFLIWKNTVTASLQTRIPFYSESLH